MSLRLALLLTVRTPTQTSGRYNTHVSSSPNSPLRTGMTCGQTLWPLCRPEGCVMTGALHLESPATTKANNKRILTPATCELLGSSPVSQFAKLSQFHDSRSYGRG